MLACSRHIQIVGTAQKNSEQKNTAGGGGGGAGERLERTRLLTRVRTDVLSILFIIKRITKEKKL